MTSDEELYIQYENELNIELPRKFKAAKAAYETECKRLGDISLELENKTNELKKTLKQPLPTAQTMPLDLRADYSWEAWKELNSEMA